MELSMKSYDIQVLNETNKLGASAKKPWVKPSVEIIALESAENGTNPTRSDAGGGHYSRPRS
jgi:hypothetical protein